MNPVAQMVFAASGLFGLAGLGMVLFPGVVKRLSDTRYDDPLAVRKPPEFTRLRSEGSYRLLGAGLLVVAAMAVYYGFAIR